SVEWLQPWMTDLVVAEHLLHKELRIGSYVDGCHVVCLRPLQCRQQTAIFGHIVRGDANRLAELFDQRAVRRFKANAVSGGTRITARATIDVGNNFGWH